MASLTIAALTAIGSIASAGASWYFGSKNNDLQEQSLEQSRKQLELQKQQYNENLRSSYYSYMQQLASMEGDYAQNQLSLNQTVEDIASNQNYLDRWASEYDQSMQSTIDEVWDSYQNQASAYTAGLVTSAEKGQKGGSAGRVNKDNALALKNLTGTSDGSFSLSSRNRLGSYVQSAALDILADRHTALSAVDVGYKSIDSYREAMSSLSNSISSMNKSTSEIKETLKKEGLTV